MTLPPTLRAAAEAEARRLLPSGAGEVSMAYALLLAEWLFAELLKSAPEFDEDESKRVSREVFSDPLDDALIEKQKAFRSGARWQHSQLSAQVAALNAQCELGTKVITDQDAELARLRSENVRYYNALQSVTEDGHLDCRWCVHNDEIARAALNLQPAQQEVRMSPQEKADVLEWALRRAMDKLEKILRPGMQPDKTTLQVYGEAQTAAHFGIAEITKILADNGLEYDADGKLVERKADSPDAPSR